MLEALNTAGAGQWGDEYVPYTTGVRLQELNLELFINWCLVYYDGTEEEARVDPAIDDSLSVQGLCHAVDRNGQFIHWHTLAELITLGNGEFYFIAVTEDTVGRPITPPVVTEYGEFYPNQMFKVVY